ncbi:MAG: PKD domain-containing protein, partial [Methanoregula sp.]
VVFMNDTSTWTTSQISSDTTGSYFQGVPSISSNKIVWVDDFPNFPNSTIMLSQISGGEQQISDGNSGPFSDGQMAPSIDGNRVVWVDFEGDPTNGMIYMNETDNPSFYQIPIASSLYGEPLLNPKISGNRIVWEEANSQGLSNIHLFTIGASGTCPIVTFTKSATSGGAPLSVSFTDATTPEYAPAHWFWNFGDGIGSYEQNPVHQFMANGQYLVNLTVSDAYCRNLSTSQTITVGSPVAQFTGTPLSGLVPVNVQFNDTSTGTSINIWNWSFGDNTWYNTTLPSQKNPAHQYSQPGTYSVQLFVTNPYGTGNLTRNGYITVLPGVQALATTPINGIGVDNRYGGQYLTYNITLAGNPTLNPAHSILVSFPPGANGWQNVTFVASDAMGFSDTGGNYTGNISRVYIQTENIAATGFSSALGNPVFVSYLMDLPGYPDPASLNTEVWESALAQDNTSLSSIALKSGFTLVDSVAYTANFTKTNIGNAGNVTINMSVTPSWVAGAGTTDITAIGINPSTGIRVGTILPTRYAGTDGTLDYFTADIPSQYAYFSKFILAKYSGSGNLFQIITLVVSNEIQSPANTRYAGSGSWSGSGNSPPTYSPTAVQTNVAPQSTVSSHQTAANPVVTFNPIPAPPAPTALSTDVGIIGWLTETFGGHIYLVGAGGIAVMSLIYIRRRRRRFDPLG